MNKRSRRPIIPTIRDYIFCPHCLRRVNILIRNPKHVTPWAITDWPRKRR